MNVSRTRGAARRMRRSISVGGDGGCRYRPVPRTGPDDALRQVCSGEPLTIAELRRAAAILGAYVPSGRMDVLVARVRIAVRLEKLGA